MRICLGYRPKIRCEVPQLLLDLMNKCIDAEPQNRPTAKELSTTLYSFFEDLKNKKTELYKQVKNIKNLDKNLLTYGQVKYQTHPQAIYTSRSLNLSKLSKPVNAVSRLIDYEIPNDQVNESCYAILQ
ncbi:20871_t:CDS:2, partial [Cetraspora pellucida]